MRSLLILLLAMSISAAQAFEWNGRVDLDARVFPAAASGTIESTQGMNVMLEGFQDLGDHRAVVELVGRYDRRDSGRRSLEARQAYLRFLVGEGDVFIGHRQTFWGTAESANPVDLINQSDGAAQDGKEAKLGAPSVSYEQDLDVGLLQLWYMPHFRERTFNDADAHPSAGLPMAAAQFDRDRGANADDVAARLSTYAGDWDLAFSAFHGTARDPILVVAGGSVTPTYPRLKSLGLEAQYTGDASLWKFEVLSGEQSGDDVLAAVGGVEYTLYGLAGRVWDLGLIAEVSRDDRPQATADQMNTLGGRLTLNDTQDTSVLVLASRDADNEQSFYSVEATRRITKTSSLSLEGRWYDADRPTLPLGVLADDDELRMRFSVFF